jgi:AraC-like DNA-binding protein
MDLMEQYEIMSNTDSIPLRDQNITRESLNLQKSPMISNVGNENDIHVLNESFVISFWRTTPDSKVAFSLNFFPPVIIYIEDWLKAGMSPMHRHDYMEIAYVVKGEFSQFIGGKKHTFSQGSLCIVDKNSEHADYVKDQDNFVIFLGMKEEFFDELFLSELDDNNVQQFIRKALIKQKSLKQFIHFTPRDAQDLIFPLIEQVITEKFENRKGARYMIKALMIRIFDILTTDYDISLTSTQLKKMNDLVFAEVEEYLMKNYKEASLKKLTEQFHFQQDYFARLFKRHAGITFTEFLRKIRISKSEELLLNTRMSISSIIESVGYENRHHFYNIFYEIHNMTPEQYRQKYGINEKNEYK